MQWLGVCIFRGSQHYCRAHAQAHPNLPVLATSGIERTVKIWSPGDERASDPCSLVQAMKDNQVCPASVVS